MCLRRYSLLGLLDPTLHRRRRQMRLCLPPQRARSHPIVVDVTHPSADLLAGWHLGCQRRASLELDATMLALIKRV